MSASAAPASFQIQYGPATEVPVALKPWIGMPAGAMPFGSAQVDSTAEPIWRVNLPADPGGAAGHLLTAERVLDDVQRALPLAARRLPAAAHVSFAATESMAAPEAALGAAMAEIATLSHPEAVDFASWRAPLDAWGRANAAFASAVAHLRRLVGGRSWVETRLDTRLLARTALGRTGDQATVWLAGTPVVETPLHLRAVALAQQSRAALARTIGLALRGATLLAAVATGPAGALLALPAAWKFVDDVVAEVGMAQTRREEVAHAE